MTEQNPTSRDADHQSSDMAAYSAYPVPTVSMEIASRPEDPSLEEVTNNIGAVVGHMFDLAKLSRDPIAPVPRMKNAVILAADDGVLAQRRSYEFRPRKRDRWFISRKIDDTMFFERLDSRGAPFNAMGIAQLGAELRSTKERKKRQITKVSWEAVFTADRSYTGNADFSVTVQGHHSEHNEHTLITVSTHEGDEKYASQADKKCGIKSYDELSVKYPNLAAGMAHTLEVSYGTVAQKLNPEMSELDYVGIGQHVIRDPHARHIGRLARIADLYYDKRSS